MTSNPPLCVLIYAPADRGFAERLKTHLRPLEQQGRIELWDELSIPAGGSRADIIERQMARADLYVALLSPDLQADGDGWGQVERALDRHRRGASRLFPVKLCPILIERTPLAGVQLLPRDTSWVVGCSSQDAVWVEIAREIDGAAEQFQAERSRATGGSARQDAPRTLIAGPFFGLPINEHPDIAARWTSDTPEALFDFVRAKLDMRETCATHIAALLRFDTIVDLSPWAAFSRWSSTGCRVASPVQDLSGEAGVPLVVALFDPRLPLSPRPAGLAHAMLVQVKMAMEKLHGRLSSRIAIAGFLPTTIEWAAAVVASSQGVEAVDVPEDEAPLLSAAIRQRGLTLPIGTTAEPLDSLGAAADLDDYRRALRIVAGQLLLPGDVAPRPAKDVFIDMDVQRLEARSPLSDALATPREDRQANHELMEELRDREARRWEPPTPQILQATSLAAITPCVLLWGKAGTGKSTLLRQLASNAQTDRCPIWLQRVPELNDNESFGEMIARQALEEVYLGSAARLRRLLRAKIEAGEVHLLLDGLDEAPPASRASLPEWLRTLHPDTRVLIASRPSRAPRLGFEEIELLGLSVSGPEQMLHAYFGESAWTGQLLHALRELPDGPVWSRTPLLLALAARIYENRGELPRATLALYEAAVDHLLERARRRWPFEKGAVQRELSALAARLLLPAQGEIRVTFAFEEIAGDDDLRETLRRSGLFVGRDRLRFAHLSLGEYLAARADIDLPAQRARLRREELPDAESALQVLPMAHAYQGLPALEALWSDAIGDDAPDHRLLRLLLQALGYGGEGVEAFARQRARLLMAEIANRLQPGSGRFGDVERVLLGDLERSMGILEPYVRQFAEREFKPLLRSHGEVGVEASTLLYGLGAIPKPERRISSWWPTVWRQARALVRRGAQVKDIVDMTLGQRMSGTRSEAVRILGRYPRYRPLLRHLTRDPQDFVREAAVAALGEDEAALPMLRERLADDATRVRSAAAFALGRAEWITAHAPVLARLLYDNYMVAHAAIDVLGQHVASRPALRRRGEELLESGSFFDLGDIIEVLADDPDADALISAYLRHLGNWSVSQRALSALSRVPRWRSVLVELLVAGQHVEKLVPALASSADASTRDVIAGFLTHANRRVRLDAALAAIDRPEAVATLKEAFKDSHALLQRFSVVKEEDERSLAHLAVSKVFAEDEDIFNAVHQVVIAEDAPQKLVAMRLLAWINLPKARTLLWRWFDETTNSDVRVQIHRPHVLRALKDDGASRARLLDALGDSSEDVRKTAIELLQGDPDAKEAIRARLQDESGQVQFAAAEAFSDEPQIQALLLKLLPLDLEAPRTAAFITLAAQREHRQRLVEVFREGPEALKLSALVPLSMSHETRSEVYSCMDDLESDAAKRVASLLGGDEEIRRRVRRALSQPLPKREVFFGIDWLFDVVAGDPALEAFFSESAEVAWVPLARAAIAALAKYPSRRLQLFDLVRHKSPAVAAAAIRALANEPEMAERSAAEIQRDDLPEEVLAAWVYAAGRNSAPGARVRSLISHNSYTVRLAAVRATRGEPASWPDLRAQLDKESREEVKSALFDALARDPDAAPVFRVMLRDSSSAVRRRATQLLRPHPLPAAHAIDTIGSVHEAARLAHGSPPESSTRPEDVLLRRVADVIAHPTELHLDEDRALGEALLGWLAARLTWASPDGAFHDGRVWGEVEQPLRRLSSDDGTVVIRVAMDAIDLPRERLLHPNHNLIEAWRVAQLLTSDAPPALVLACADVGFEHLAPPELAPGQVLCGPTFYGFRIARRVLGAGDVPAATHFLERSGTEPVERS